MIINKIFNSLISKQLLLFVIILLSTFLQSQTLLKPDRVFDGFEMHEKWVVFIEGNKIKFTGAISEFKMPENTKVIDLNGMTLLPGLIEGHSHLFLHPYNEASWNKQLMIETNTERIIRASIHAKKTLYAGFTSIRDLGTEGLGYSDVYLNDCIKKELLVGPRILTVGPAIVSTGSYGPKGYNLDVTTPIGAQIADGEQSIIKTVREQIGNNVDFIKVYADAYWGKDYKEEPTFSETELKLIVSTANSAGRGVVAHASTFEGMKRAINSGVETIEHGDGGTLELFQLMLKKGIALCPTLYATESIEKYKGWKKGIDKDPIDVINKKLSFKLALTSGVTICFGGDAGVFPHGENAKELELMVEYGMKPIDAIKSATSINAKIFHLDNKFGFIKTNYIADIIAVEGNPIDTISNMSLVKFVMKDGIIYKN